MLQCEVCRCSGGKRVRGEEKIARARACAHLLHPPPVRFKHTEHRTLTLEHAESEGEPVKEGVRERLAVLESVVLLRGVPVGSPLCVTDKLPVGLPVRVRVRVESRVTPEVGEGQGEVFEVSVPSRDCVWETVGESVGEVEGVKEGTELGEAPPTLPP